MWLCLESAQVEWRLECGTFQILVADSSSLPLLGMTKWGDSCWFTLKYCWKFLHTCNMKLPVPAGTSHPLSHTRVGLFDTFQPTRWTPLPYNTTISFWISALVLTSQISFWWDNPRLTDVQCTWHEPWSQSFISVVFCTWQRPKRLCCLHFSLTPMDVGVWSWNMQSHSSGASVLSCVTTLSANR